TADGVHVHRQRGPFPTRRSSDLLAAEGMAERLQLLYPDEQERAAHYPEYKERLDTECDTIIEMGFPGYFLIVADFINWGKENGRSEEHTSELQSVAISHAAICLK